MKIQIARTIFLSNLTIMKKILDLVAFKVDKKSEDYKYYKKEIMSYTYIGLKKLFKQLEEAKIIEPCPCNAKLHQGFKDCEDCGGSGFRNKI